MLPRLAESVAIEAAIAQATEERYAMAGGCPSTRVSLRRLALSSARRCGASGDEWAHYQRSASLRAYVLVSQRSRRIEVFTRDATQTDLCHNRDHGVGTRVELSPLDVSIEVDAVYASPLES